MRITNNNIEVEKVTIEWTGNIDKPIPKIIICANCVKDKKMLKKHQYNISSKTLKNIKSIFIKGNKTESEININETNRKIYLLKLNDVILILMKNNENDLLIEELKNFIVRINY